MISYNLQYLYSQNAKESNVGFVEEWIIIRKAKAWNEYLLFRNSKLGYEMPIGDFLQ